MNTANLYIRMRNPINSEIEFDFEESTFLRNRLIDNWNCSETCAMMHFIREFGKFVIA